jgi:hypothetical protein
MAKKKQDKDDKNDPIKTKNDVKQSKDPRIDQDFENFPNAPGHEDIISPNTEEEHKIADTDHKDGEKMSKKEKNKAQEEIDEQGSDGSGGAFEATEQPNEQQKNKDAKTISDH